MLNISLAAHLRDSANLMIPEQLKFPRATGRASGGLRARMVPDGIVNLGIELKDWTT